MGAQRRFTVAEAIEARRHDFARRGLPVPADDAEECWRGRARMAAARLAAGCPLDDDDREALRRWPGRSAFDPTPAPRNVA